MRWPLTDNRKQDTEIRRHIGIILNYFQESKQIEVQKIPTNIINNYLYVK